MEVKAKASITISHLIDILSATRYYLLQLSTLAPPAKPTANPPSDWSTTEPDYTSGSTSTLYFVDCTVFTNDTFTYSEVSKSSSYEAAKEAYNKANETFTEISQLKDRIVSIVEDGDNGTSITQTSNGVKITFKTAKKESAEDDCSQYIIDADGLQEQLDTAATDITGVKDSIDNTNSDIDALRTAYSDRMNSTDEAIGEIQGNIGNLDKKTQYIDTGVEDNKPYVELGVTDSEFGLRVTNESIDFRGGTATPARITSDELEINKAKVTNELGFGGFVWARRSNGNMGIIWKGANS